jgi:single-strand DNA-binding protein
MSDVNRAVLVGRLVRDPEFRTTSSGTAMSLFCLALNHGYHDRNSQWQEERAFVPCTTFGRATEQVGQTHKGDTLLVMGRLRTDSWQSKGTTQTRLVLVVQEIHSIKPFSQAAAVVSEPGSAPLIEGVQTSMPF